MDVFIDLFLRIVSFVDFCFRDWMIDCTDSCFELCRYCFYSIHRNYLDKLYFLQFDQVLQGHLQYHHLYQLLLQVTQVLFYPGFHRSVQIYLFQKLHIQILIFMLQKAHQIYLFLDQHLQMLKHYDHLNH